MTFPALKAPPLIPHALRARGGGHGVWEDSFTVASSYAEKKSILFFSYYSTEMLSMLSTSKTELS